MSQNSAMAPINMKKAEKTGIDLKLENIENNNNNNTFKIKYWPTTPERGTDTFMIWSSMSTSLSAFEAICESFMMIILCEYLAKEKFFLLSILFCKKRS